MGGEREHDGGVRNKGPADGTQASGDRTPHLVLRTAQPTLMDRALRTEDLGDAPRHPAQARPSGRTATRDVAKGQPRRRTRRRSLLRGTRGTGHP